MHVASMKRVFWATVVILQKLVTSEVVDVSAD